MKEDGGECRTRGPRFQWSMPGRVEESLAFVCSIKRYGAVDVTSQPMKHKRPAGLKRVPLVFPTRCPAFTRLTTCAQLKRRLFQTCALTLSLSPNVYLGICMSMSSNCGEMRVGIAASR